MKIRNLLKYTRWGMASAMGTIAVYLFITLVNILKILLRFFIDSAESFNNTETILIFFGFIYLITKICAILLNKVQDYLDFAEDLEDAKANTESKENDA